MKISIAEILIIMGGLLILTPVILAERQRARIAEFYQKQGNGAILPAEMHENGAYDWVCLGTGMAMAFYGVRQAVRSSNKQGA